MNLRFAQYFRRCTTEAEQSAAIDAFGALDDVARQYMLGCLLVDVQESLAAHDNRHEELFGLLLTELERVLTPLNAADAANTAAETSTPAAAPAAPVPPAPPAPRADQRRKPPPAKKAPPVERPHPEPNEGGGRNAD